MMQTSKSRRVALLIAGVTLTACMDLTVPNLNNPDRLRATGTPDDVEGLIASTFRGWWPRVYGTSPTIMLSTLADEFTTGFTDFGSQEHSSEPRPQWNNSSVYGNQGTLYNTWLDFYGVISIANDGLAALDRGIKIGPNGANNSRARAFGKFMQGVAHGYLALIFDQAVIVDENTDVDTLITPNYRPYTEVMTAAIAMLNASIAISDTATFTLPNVGWIPGLTLTNKDLARLANTYIARFMAYVPRNATERAGVNWTDVITRIDAGITANFAPIGEADIFEDFYKQRAARQRTTTPSDFMRADYWLVGPADSTNGFLNWVATPVANRTPFQMRTRDRRIQGTTGPTSRGKYFGFHNSTVFAASRGLYHRSFYAYFRLGTGTSWQQGPLIAVARSEMDLLKAEALIRLNRAAEALPLINATRVANGELPQVDINGPPDVAGCVPRKLSGACGSLWDALRYEKRIEGAGTDGQVAWYDARGWTALVRNSIIHFPIPARELEVVRKPLYTLGGGGAGSAPDPAPEACPVTLPRC
jgi:hypothetical protein